MQPKSFKNYQNDIKEAIELFWNTRTNQSQTRKKTDQGTRSSVTAGKHLDGFVKLLVKIAKDIGVPDESIFTKGNILPGYFRPSKDWDLVIISKEKHLIAAIEFKSQVGSFGNNFNNRTEEALGNAIDLWTAFRENCFPQTTPPWVGYVIIVEKNKKSTQKIKIQEPHYPVREEFQQTSYLERYQLLCQKLMLEKHYNAASIIWTDSSKNFGYLDNELSIESFLNAFIGYLYGKLNKF